MLLVLIKIEIYYLKILGKYCESDIAIFECPAHDMLTIDKVSRQTGGGSGSLVSKRRVMGNTGL
jgi:hypothetical protein